MEIEGFEHHDYSLPRQPYSYNGKEELLGGLIAYEARLYDPWVRRFTDVDPIADEFPKLSVYNYASNNPILNVDLHGLQGANFNFKEYAAGLLNNIFGTSYSTFAEPKNNPQRYVTDVTIAAEGNAKIGAGLKVKVGGVGVALNVGSIEMANLSVGTDGVNGSLASSENYTLDREAALTFGVADDVGLKIGASQEVSRENGEVASDVVKANAGIVINDITYGISTGSNQSENSDEKSFGLSIGSELQILVGVEGKLKFEVKTSTTKPNSKDEED